MPIKSVARQTAHEIRRRALRRKLTVTVPLTDYAEFYHVAQAAGDSVPSTILRLAREQLHAEPFLSEADRVLLNHQIRQLRAIGNNLNQIAHACHLQTRAETVPEAVHCLEYLRKLHGTLNRLEGRFSLSS